ncbi:hypothetical protein BDW74DRAFT_181206 [Aspergillus multicolor]|uniref:uncharacterized protein n=1 Tax=Aspergillus multicolor TaxID=41759 RepID=UPI003CCCF495
MSRNRPPALLGLGFSLLLLPATTLITTALGSSHCYFSKGVSTSDSATVACSSTSGESGNGMCCALNRDNPYGGAWSDGLTADACIDNGLCKNVVTTYSTELDEKVTVKAESDYARSTAQITPCDGADISTKWCCGTNTTCCGTSSAVTIVSILPALASASSTPSPSSSSTANTTVSTNHSSNHSSNLSTGAKIGIGVGGVAVIAGAIFLAMCIRRKKDLSVVYAPAPGGSVSWPGSPAMTEYGAPSVVNVNGHGQDRPYWQGEPYKVSSTYISEVDGGMFRSLAEGWR